MPKGWKLDYHVPKAILNGCLAPYVGGKRRPVYFDVAATYPALAAVTESYPVIREEFDRLLEECQALPAYHDLDAGEAKIADVTPKRWSVFAKAEAFAARTRRIDPLPWLPNLLNRFVTGVVARHTYGRKIAAKAEAFAARTRRIVGRCRAAA
jgi:hypothetical protein